MFISMRPKAGALILGIALVVFTAAGVTPGASSSGRYVGSAECQDCHETEYENFKQYSKKAHAGESIKIMAGDLTRQELEECYACHVTGYGKPGGFVSFEETPELADAGCEACHGPGYDHVESGGDPYLIKGDLEVSDCETCHNAERVAAFDYKPLLFGGAH
ncbi:cytochrome c family protein [Salidesulfovibrio brasiliensis]|uniref:cytochrome c family protein n=1 Tax=Salidesulfovibrio brasiliensis TaxID=221711 RepID=UPI000AB44BE2|nr:cytochrome c family protein [Salidesulfovibrio brasiliensis]